MKCIQHGVVDEFGGVSLNALALAASVFGAAVFGFGRVFDDVAHAQAVTQTEVALILPREPQAGGPLQMSDAAQAEVAAALRGMGDGDLSLTYARICATFRAYIGQDDLSVARALVDYAALAETEMAARGMRRPAGTEAAQEMLTTYLLVL